LSSYVGEALAGLAELSPQAAAAELVASVLAVSEFRPPISRLTVETLEIRQLTSPLFRKRAPVSDEMAAGDVMRRAGYPAAPFPTITDLERWDSGAWRNWSRDNRYSIWLFDTTMLDPATLNGEALDRIARGESLSEDEIESSFR
jgi:hypothetical protein